MFLDLYSTRTIYLNRSENKRKPTVDSSDVKNAKERETSNRKEPIVSHQRLPQKKLKVMKSLGNIVDNSNLHDEGERARANTEHSVIFTR